VPENEFLINLGLSIKKYRESKGLTQPALALACDTDKQNISRIEQGKVNISMITLKKIADALNLPVKDLLDF
jgi:transcriptional regulator with XRE-family HTH domain